MKGFILSHYHTGGIGGRDIILTLESFVVQDETSLFWFIFLEENNCKCMLFRLI